ncbi:hypothetical protein D4R78_03000 [bacterium]|nr:MAG: hypothetical protein D4R78_03000 [bacterium]
MGVVYKLKSEVKEYITQLKKNTPQLSCRKAIAIVSKKFNILISKSSVNAIFKNTGLSMPVGRRRKVKKGVVSAKGLGALFLKAADYILGGSMQISETIRRLTNRQEKDLINKIEGLIYLPIFKSINQGGSNYIPESALKVLTGKYISVSELESFLEELNAVPDLARQTLTFILNTITSEVRNLKFTASNESNFFIDGQFYTIWSTPYSPYDFSAPVASVKSRINKSFKQNAPLVLFSAPGYGIPTRELFYFMMGMNNDGSLIPKLSLLSNEGKELETIPLENTAQRFFLIGVWPWQFTDYRKIKNISEFRKFQCAFLENYIYLADIELELWQPDLNKELSLKGCVLKVKPGDKVNLIILTNLPQGKDIAEKISELYLSNWPVPEDAFDDFSRKIELFTYAAGSRKYFSPGRDLPFEAKGNFDIKEVFNYYLRVLDLFARHHLFPFGYEEKDFVSMCDNFYSLEAIIRKQKGYSRAIFHLPAGYQYLKALRYSCNRANEKEVFLDNGLRLLLDIQVS